MSQSGSNIVHSVDEIGEVFDNRTVTASSQVGQILLDKGYIDQAQLDKALEEKKKREYLEKNLNDEQAHMWKQDQSNYQQEEKRLTNKI